MGGGAIGALITRSPNGLDSVHLLSRVQLSATLWTPAHQASLSHHQLLELAQTHVYQVGDAIQSSQPLLSPSLLLPLIFPSIRVFSSESVLHIQVAKVLEFQFQQQSFQ